MTTSLGVTSPERELQRLPAIDNSIKRPQPTQTISVSLANMSEGLFYNIANGYVEGIVRGYRNTLLTGQQYNNLTQCENIDGE